MKNSVLLILFISILNIANAAEEIETDSKINEVTVFLKGAQINRTANVNLKSGLTKIAFQNISRFINDESLQINVNKDIEIVDVNFASQVIDKEQFIEKLDFAIKQQYNDLKNKIKAITDVKAVYNSEIKILDKQKSYLLNVKLGGNHNKETETKMKLAELLPYYKTEYANLTKKTIELHQKIKEEDKKLKTENDKLKKFIKKNSIETNNKNAKQIEVLVNAEFATNVKFDLKYLVNAASWQPIYDIKASDISKPIEISYKAKIIQNTGVKWENVKLSVSSSNPAQSKERPVMNPKYISLGNNYYKEIRNADYEQNQMMQNTYGVKGKSASSRLNVIPPKYVAPTTYAESEINMNYTLTRNYNIPSGNKSHFVNLKKENIASEFVYHAVPKMDCSAYLVAKIKDWNSLNLLSGKASLYFDDTFIGKSFINTKLLEDYLILSFGVDERINVERNKLDTKDASSFFDSKKTELFSYQIKVQNNNLKTINFELLDQYPLSNNGEIEVALTKNGKAEVNEKLGSLMWKFEIAPNETKNVAFQYSVRYPKNEIINY